MKSPNTAFSFAPPSILSLTICKTVALIISKNHTCSNPLKTRGRCALLPLKKEGTEKHTIFILTLIKKKKSIRVFMILVDFLLGEI